MGAQLSKGGAEGAESAAAKTNGQVKDPCVHVGSFHIPSHRLLHASFVLSGVSEAFLHRCVWGCVGVRAL